MSERGNIFIVGTSQGAVWSKVLTLNHQYATMVQSDGMSWVGDELRFVGFSTPQTIMVAVDFSTQYAETFLYYRYQSHIHTRADTLVQGHSVQYVGGAIADSTGRHFRPSIQLVGSNGAVVMAYEFGTLSYADHNFERIDNMEKHGNKLFGTTMCTGNTNVC